MSVFSDVFDYIFGDSSPSATPTQQAPSTSNWGSNLASIFSTGVQIAAPFITAEVTKPNKPKYPTVPESVSNDPRVQQLVGPYGGYTNAPSISAPSPFQIAFPSIMQQVTNLVSPAKESPGVTAANAPGIKVNPVDPGLNSQEQLQTPLDNNSTLLTPSSPIKQQILQSVTPYDDIIKQATTKYPNVPPALVQSVIHAESNGVPTAVSKKGATGLMQLLPSTANELAGQTLSHQALTNPATNIDLGTQYLSKLVTQFGSDNGYDKVIAAYNAGPGRIASANSRAYYPPETKTYSRRVKNYMRLLGGS